MENMKIWEGIKKGDLIDLWIEDSYIVSGMVRFIYTDLDMIEMKLDDSHEEQGQEIWIFKLSKIFGYHLREKGE